MINYDKVNMMSDADIIKWAEEKDNEYFEALVDTYNGYHTGVICVGPPGVGKSYESRLVLEQQGCKHINLLNSDYEKDDDDNWQCVRYDVGNGPLVRKSDYSNWALYADVYGNRSKKFGGLLDKAGVVINDDNDEIMKDTVGLAIMMAMTEREIVKDVDFTRAEFNNELKKRDIPSKFQSDSKLVILTNFKIIDEPGKWARKEKGYTGKKPPYITRWEALGSRMEYVDMELDHPRLLRVYVENKLHKHQILQNDPVLVERYGRGAKDSEVNKVIKWLRENQLNLKQNLDLRLAQDIASWMIRYPKEWQIKCKRYVNTK